MARVAQLEHAGAALAAQVRGPEVGLSGGAEVVEPLERLLRRAQHRVDEPRARLRVGEHVREQLALLELEALLVGEHPPALLREVGPGVGQEGLDPQRAGARQLEVAPGGLRHAVPTRSGSGALRVKRPPSAGASSGAKARRSDSS